jgi:hypothetical protein
LWCSTIRHLKPDISDSSPLSPSPHLYLPSPSLISLYHESPFSVDSTKVSQRIKSKDVGVVFSPRLTSFSQKETRPRSPPLKEWPPPPEQPQRPIRTITSNWQRRSPGRSCVYGRVSCVAVLYGRIYIVGLYSVAGLKAQIYSTMRPRFTPIPEGDGSDQSDDVDRDQELTFSYSSTDGVSLLESLVESQLGLG